MAYIDPFEHQPYSVFGYNPYKVGDFHLNEEIDDAYKRYMQWLKDSNIPSKWVYPPNIDYATGPSESVYQLPPEPIVIHMKFKDIVASHLLAVCEEANVLARNKLNDKEGKPRNNIKDETIKKFIEVWRAEIELRSGEVILQLFSEAFNDKRFLKGLNKDEALYPIYSVILLTSKQSSHSYELNKPLIISHAIKNQCLKYDGTTTANNPFFETDGPRLATSEEIKFCIENLSDAQWQTILTNASFSPVVNGAMDTEIEEINTNEDTSE